MRIIVICLLLLNGLISSVYARNDQEVALQYPEFSELISQSDLEHVTVVNNGSGRTYIMGIFPNNHDYGGRPFRVEIAEFNEVIQSRLKEGGVGYTSVEQRSSGIRNMSAGIPIILMALYIALVVFIVVMAVRLVRAVERIAENTGK